MQQQIYKFLLYVFLFKKFKTKNWSYHWLKIIAGEWVKQIFSYRTTRLSQRIFTISSGWIFFKIFSMFRRIRFSLQEKKTDILILKVMIKDLYCFFCKKTQYSFILINWVSGELCVYMCVCVCVCVCSGDEMSLTIEVIQYMSNVVLGTNNSYK